MGGLRMESRIRIGSWGYAERMGEAEGERRRGWELKRTGKQILMAGLLASSAPVVVPPLVVVSVIGVSVTIPFGLYWASYAWAHKLMSKLLPMPATDTPGEGCGKECVVVVNHARRPAAEKGSEEAVDESESDINMRDDSHKPVPSAMTAEETIGLHQDDSPAALCLTEINYCAESSSAVVNEERLWGEVNAIRVVVGYEGTPQASCVDELKRLYIVAGVEPPSLLSASCQEIHDHLHFLMSILGVKSNGP